MPLDPLVIFFLHISLPLTLRPQHHLRSLPTTTPALPPSPPLRWLLCTGQGEGEGEWRWPTSNGVEVVAGSLTSLTEARSISAQLLPSMPAARKGAGGGGGGGRGGGWGRRGRLGGGGVWRRSVGEGRKEPAEGIGLSEKDGKGQFGHIATKSGPALS